MQNSTEIKIENTTFNAQFHSMSNLHVLSFVPTSAPSLKNTVEAISFSILPFHSPLLMSGCVHLPEFGV